MGFVSGVLQRGEEELKGAQTCPSSILPVTMATPLRETNGVYGNLWGVNLNRRETTTEGREERDEEDDRWQAGMGEGGQ